MPSVKEWLFGSNDKFKKLPTGTKEQGQFHGSILDELKQMLQPGGGYNMAQDYHKNILDPSSGAFENFSEPYMQQFQEQILPQLAERFAGMGALSSSGFGQAIGGAASGLQSELAKLFSNLQQQSAQSESNQFNQLGSMGLNHQPFAYQNKKGGMGVLGPLLISLMQGSGSPLTQAGLKGLGM